MFLKFFGFREQPFGVTPDPRFLYLSSAHREALASLIYGIESDLGFLALIAKPGMGKTTLLFRLLEKFQSSARTAFLFQTQCTSRQFMRFLIAELGCETDRQDFVRSYEEFNKYLLQEARAGNRLLPVIDEAQNLNASVLETQVRVSTPGCRFGHRAPGQCPFVLWWEDHDQVNIKWSQQMGQCHGQTQRSRLAPRPS